ncbi:MAG TPA: hypothetical protein VM431_13235 [Phycisphaerae bacterium]|nr:hypothetical protein [Phycisphaerae bacterium]
MRRIAAACLLVALAALAAPAPARGGVGMGVIEEHPDAARERWREKAEETFKEGMKARAAGDQTNAVRFLLRCAKMESMRIDSPYPEKAFNELKIITEEARKELLVARDFLSGEAPTAGISELRRIARTYFGLYPAKEAGALLRQLEGDPKFQATLKAARLTEDLARAETLEAEAAALAKPPDPAPQPTESPEKPVSKLPTKPPEKKPDGVQTAAVTEKELTPAERRAARIEKLAEAYEIYGRVAQEGADTDPGRKAAAARERLEKDAALMARIKRAQAAEEAREWLGLANNYFRAGRFESAKQYCMKILSEFPKTPQAAEAKRLLEAMK